jgi:hypothetical protein
MTLMRARPGSVAKAKIGRGLPFVYPDFSSKKHRCLLALVCSDLFCPDLFTKPVHETLVGCEDDASTRSLHGLKAR